ncbi:hypothetical protein GGR62_001510 [Xanthomonas campestris]|nr:hypothetical protein [Xanthomonas sp. 3075]
MTSATDNRKTVHRTTNGGDEEHRPAPKPQTLALKL